MNLGVALGMGKPFLMNSWLSGWMTKAKRRMLRKRPVGFHGQELQRALGLGEEWQVAAHEHPLGGYRFMAWR